MEIKIIKAYQDHDGCRASFNQLAREVFQIGFEDWYQNGFWGENYIPYSVLEDQMVVANVSVNRMNFNVNGKSRSFIQLGTVMTKEGFRNKGYIRLLMERVKADFAKNDGMFLWANDSVLDFYPRFGFEACGEYRYQKNMEICQNPSADLVHA